MAYCFYLAYISFILRKKIKLSSLKKKTPSCCSLLTFSGGEPGGPGSQLKKRGYSALNFTSSTPGTVRKPSPSFRKTKIPKWIWTGIIVSASIIPEHHVYPKSKDKIELHTSNTNFKQGLCTSGIFSHLIAGYTFICVISVHYSGLARLQSYNWLANYF